MFLKNAKEIWNSNFWRTKLLVVVVVIIVVVVVVVAQSTKQTHLLKDRSRMTFCHVLTSFETNTTCSVLRAARFQPHWTRNPSLSR